MTELDLAYLAGLVDGEGNISVSRTSTSSSAKGCKRGFSYRSSLVISMTSLQVLEWCQQVTGVGKICIKKKYQEHHVQAYSWAVWSKEAQLLCTKLLPYLKIKKTNAENLINFQSSVRSPGKFGLSDTEWKERENYYNTSKRLNTGGIT